VRRLGKLEVWRPGRGLGHLIRVWDEAFCLGYSLRRPKQGLGRLIRVWDEAFCLGYSLRRPGRGLGRLARVFLFSLICFALGCTGSGMAAIAVSAAADGPKFIELADSEFSEVTAEAIVKLPPLDSHERAMLGHLVRCMALGPAEYSRGDLMAITGGRIIRCQVMPDHLMIEVPAYKEDMAGAISVLAEVLRSPRLDDGNSDGAREDTDPWESILHGPFTSSDGKKLRSGELEEFYHRIFRPETVTVAVSGPFASDAAQRVWDQKIAGWVAPKLLRPWPAPQALPNPAPVIGAFELDGPAINPDSSDLGSSILSLFALGCGKGGSLHRLAREQDAFSYRQEAILWPSNDGWIPRLVVAAADLKDPQTAGEELKKQLLADVDSWTEADRSRAVGLAEGVLLRGVPLSPFYFHADRPVTGSITDRPFLEAYWLSKTGNPWSAAQVVSRLQGVSLAALKASATRMLSLSQLVVRSPKP
jgi:hypothetical protein